MSTTPTTYNVAGHVCPDTGRLAMTVADAFERDESIGRTFYVYSEFAADAGLEPWSMLDGIDGTTETGDDRRPVSYTLDFANGRSVADIAPSRIIYMQRTKAEREPRYKLDLVNDDTGLSASFAGVPGATALEAEGYVLTMLAAHTGWRVTGSDRDHT